jgi:hypothetical protein
MLDSFGRWLGGQHPTLADLAGHFAKATETPFASRTLPDSGSSLMEVSHDHHHAVSGSRPDADAQGPDVMLALRGEVAEDRSGVPGGDRPPGTPIALL